jgi:hypothetical protein
MTRSRIWSWAGGAIGVFYVLGQYLLQHQDPYDYAAIKQQLDASIASIPMKDDWQSLRPGSTAVQNYSFDLDYKRDPSPDEVKGDAEMVADTAVRSLKQAGFNAVLQTIEVAVYTGRTIVGPNGQTQVKSYGYAGYDAATDTTRWTAPAP